MSVDRRREGKRRRESRKKRMRERLGISFTYVGIEGVDTCIYTYIA